MRLNLDDPIILVFHFVRPSWVGFGQMAWVGVYDGSDALVCVVPTGIRQ